MLLLKSGTLWARLYVVGGTEHTRSNFIVLTLLFLLVINNLLEYFLNLNSLSLPISLSHSIFLYCSGTIFF